MATERELALVEAALMAASQECNRTMMFPGGRQESYAHHGVDAAATAIRSLDPAAIIASVPQPTEQPEIIMSAQSLDDQRRMDQKFTPPELVGNLQCMVRNSQASFDGFGPEWASDIAKQSVELLEEYSDTLRSIACSLSAGGWNSEGLIHPKIADDKIRWGIDCLLQSAKRDALTQAQQQVELTDEMIHAAQSAWIDGHAPNYDGTAEARHI